MIGESYELDGDGYLVVDSTMLYNMVVEEEDVTKVVTANVRNMSTLFPHVRDGVLMETPMPFNQDISSWDVSNVTNMTQMFYSAWPLSTKT